MDLQTYIFIGRSGCGKGTQAGLLQEKIKTKDSREIFYLENGQKFREFISGETYTQKQSLEIYKNGALQPAFLSVHLWAHNMIEQMKDNVHLFIDGSPRRIEECPVLDSAMKFYNREHPHVIYINVSREWSKIRLANRARVDDDSKEVEKRLNWFDTEVLPAVEYLRNNPLYRFIDIDGEQTIEGVHNDILQAIGQ